MMFGKAERRISSAAWAVCTNNPHSTIRIAVRMRSHPQSGVAITCQCRTHEITVATMEKRVGRTPSLRSLSTLWPTQSEITLGAEHIAVKACDPLPPPRGHIQVLNGGPDMWRNAAPEKLHV